MSPHDRRQYKLMANCLQEFEKGQLKLDGLINALDALLEILQNPDAEWKASFRNEWWTLEEIYAVSLDRGETSFLKNNQNLIDQTLKNMQSLLHNKILY